MKAIKGIPSEIWMRAALVAAYGEALCLGAKISAIITLGKLEGEARRRFEGKLREVNLLATDLADELDTRGWHVEGKPSGQTVQVTTNKG